MQIVTVFFPRYSDEEERKKQKRINTALRSLRALHEEIVTVFRAVHIVVHLYRRAVPTLAAV